MDESYTQVHPKPNSFLHPKRKTHFDRSIIEETHKASVKREEKSNMLSRADLNVQNMLTSILYDIADEDKLSLGIEQKLKLISLNKKCIEKRTYEDSSSDSSSSYDKDQPIPKKMIQSITASSLVNKNISQRSNKSLFHSKGVKRNSKQRDNENLEGEAIDVVTLMRQNEENGVMGMLTSDKKSMKELTLLQTEIYNSMNIKPKICLKDSTVVYHSERIMQEDVSNAKESLKWTNIFDLGPKSKEQMRRIFKYHSPVYDSLDDEEDGKDEMNDNRYCIEPNSYVKDILDFLIVISLIASFIYLPFSIAFKRHDYLSCFYFLNFFIETCFIADIFISFYAGYFNEDDQIIREFNLIVNHYLKGWFCLDVISSLPYSTLIDTYLNFWPQSLLTKATHALCSNNPLVCAHLLKFLRFLKTIKVFSCNSFIKFCSDNYFQDMDKTKWRILYISLLLYSACINVLGCIFIFLGFNTYPNWIEHEGLLPQSVSEIYVASIYFMVTTTFAIGYGDITSRNTLERLFNVILLLFGIMTHSWTVTTLSSNFEYKEMQMKQYEAKLRTLEQIRLTHKRFPNEVDEKIKRYFKYNLEQDQCNPEEILELLPYKLRSEVVFNMYKGIINDFVFFRNFSDNEFKLKVILALRPIECLKNELIVSKGDFIEEMLFVKKGTLALELLMPSLLSEQIEKNKSMALLLNRVNSLKSNRSKINLLPSYSFNKSFTKYENNRKSIKELISMTQEIHKVKLIEIRRNEHFGDVIMFLNHRSPLQVRVQSKTAELLLLRKIDALDISISFPKIWKKIISKSAFNWKQITLIIQKTLCLFMKNSNKQHMKLENELNTIIENGDPYELDIINNENKLYESETVSKLKESNILSRFASQKESILSRRSDKPIDIIISDGNGDDEPDKDASYMSLSDSINFQLLSNHGDNARMKKSTLSSYSNRKALEDNQGAFNLKGRTDYQCIQSQFKGDITSTSNSKAKKTAISMGNESPSILLSKSAFKKSEISQELYPGEEIMSSLYLPRRNSYSNIKKFAYLRQSGSQLSILSTKQHITKRFNRSQPDLNQFSFAINIIKEDSTKDNRKMYSSSPAYPLVKLKPEDQCNSNVLTFSNEEVNFSLRSNEMSYGDIFEKRANKHTKDFVRSPTSLKLKRQNIASRPCDEILDKIGQNIEQNAINLNHPSLFYAKTFHQMIEKEKVSKCNTVQLCGKLKKIAKMIEEND